MTIHNKSPEKTAPDPLLKIKLPSGRSIQNVKQDAKRNKKKNKVTMGLALDLEAEKNGLACFWHDFIARAKDLFGGRFGLDMAHYPTYRSSLYLGSSYSGTERFALHQLFAHMQEEPQCNDWLIDVKGDSLLYAIARQKLGGHSPSKSQALHLFNYLSPCYPMNDAPQTLTHLANLVDGKHADNSLLIDTLFEREDDRVRVATLLKAELGSFPFATLLDRLGRGEGELGDEQRTRLSSVLRQSKEYGILSYLATRHAHAYTEQQVFSKDAFNLCLFPALCKAPDVVQTLLKDHLALLANWHKKNRQPMRITLIGLSGREININASVGYFLSQPDITLILASDYTASNKTGDYDAWIEKAERTFCFQREDDVPASLKTLKESLRSGQKGIVQMLRYGVLQPNVDPAKRLSFELDSRQFDPLHHANGDTLES